MKLQFQDLQSGCADGEMKMRQDSSIIANLLSQIGQSSNAYMQVHRPSAGDLANSSSPWRAPRRAQLAQKKHSWAA
jgi:hypothetical protein